jgi:hypothetical protein
MLYPSGVDEGDGAEEKGEPEERSAFSSDFTPPAAGETLEKRRSACSFDSDLRWPASTAVFALYEWKDFTVRTDERWSARCSVAAEEESAGFDGTSAGLSELRTREGAERGERGVEEEMGSARERRGGRRRRRRDDEGGEEGGKGDVLTNGSADADWLEWGELRWGNVRFWLKFDGGEREGIWGRTEDKVVPGRMRVGFNERNGVVLCCRPYHVRLAGGKSRRGERGRSDEGGDVEEFVGRRAGGGRGRNKVGGKDVGL